MPVAGVTPDDLVDTYGARRAGGRRHQGLDIFAKRGTPAIAVTSGFVKTNRNANGGNCIYLTSDDGYVFYYAHLAGWPRGIGAGDRVRAGEIIGYVGNSGNARGGRCHLHFEVHAGGRTLNPYAVLRQRALSSPRDRVVSDAAHRRANDPRRGSARTRSR
jgi:murein DD-endopeptidase MepM/ murein hydrolase activator NlpD